MKSGTKTVVGFETRRTLKKASFWISALAVPVAGAVIGMLLYFSNHAATKPTDTTIANASDKRIAILDETGIVSPAMLTRLHSKHEPSVQKGIRDVQAGRFDAFIYFPNDVAKQGTTVYARQAPGSITSSSYTTLAASLLRLSALQKVRQTMPTGQQVASILQATPSVHTTYFKNGKVFNGNSVILPGIIAAVFLVLLILSANQMITGVTEEKENRIIEILLTSVSPRSVIAGKMFSIAMLTMLQLAIIVIPLVLVDLIFFRNSPIALSHITVQPVTLLLGLAYNLLGFMMFTGLLMGIGALSPSAKDAGPFIAVTFIWTYAPFYILGLLLSNSHNIIVTVFSYFPLTAPTTMLIRNALGTTSPVLIGVTLPMLTVCAMFAILFAVRAFTNGSMEFSRRVSLRDIF